MKINKDYMEVMRSGKRLTDNEYANPNEEDMIFEATVVFACMVLCCMIMAYVMITT